MVGETGRCSLTFGPLLLFSMAISASNRFIDLRPDFVFEQLSKLSLGFLIVPGIDERQDGIGTGIIAMVPALNSCMLVESWLVCMSTQDNAFFSTQGLTRLAGLAMGIRGAVF